MSDLTWTHNEKPRFNKSAPYKGFEVTLVSAVDPEGDDYVAFRVHREGFRFHGDAPDEDTARRRAMMVADMAMLWKRFS